MTADLLDLGSRLSGIGDLHNMGSRLSGTADLLDLGSRLSGISDLHNLGCRLSGIVVHCVQNPILGSRLPDVVEISISNTF